MYHAILKPLLFSLDAERAHYLTVALLKSVQAIPGVKSIMDRMYQVSDARLEQQLFGLTFPNPVGLAAGFDKDGKSYEAMSHLGFGFIEIGTVTPVGQSGNDKPRLFRLPSEGGLINRMGFNNEGVDALVNRLRHRPKSKVIIGGNIGKNKVTPNESAIDDYLICFEKLYDHVDYFVVNVSSPNTPGLRELQDRAPLTALLHGVMTANRTKPNPKPVLLKIAPDLTDTQLDDIIAIYHETGISGLIATNTTLDRTRLQTDTETIGAGGLSGKPLFHRALEVVSYLHRKSEGKIPIIGVGGITTPEDAEAMLTAGARLVQVYSGMVYAGPTMVRDINRHLVDTYY
jgi:dihydroorotate dehydrogenase